MAKKRKLNSKNPKYLTNSEKEATQVEYRKELITVISVKNPLYKKASNIPVHALFIK